MKVWEDCIASCITAAAMEAPTETPSETTTASADTASPVREVRLNNLGIVAKALYDELGKLMLKVIHEDGFNTRERKILKNINNILVLCLRQSATGDVASKLCKSIIDGCAELETMYPLKIILNERRPEPDREESRFEPRAESRADARHESRVNNAKHKSKNHMGGSRAKKRRQGS